MKTFSLLFSALLAGILVCGLPSHAQTPPARPDFQQMRATMQQIATLRKTERNQILTALSPAHRSFLAAVVGQLAIAPSPDPQTAASQLYARLASSEKNAIVNADRAFHDQLRTIRQQMRSGMAGMPQKGPRGHGGAGRDRHAADPGTILLRITGFGQNAMRQR